MIRVTAVDTDTGETGVETLEPGNWSIICAAPCEVFSVNVYANGTVVLVLKGATKRSACNVEITGGDRR